MTDVFLVGGNAHSLRVLGAVLRVNHFRIIGQARGARDAQRFLESCTEGVIIVDSELADGAWSDVVASAVEGLVKLPVIVLSSKENGRIELEAIQRGARTVLERPFEIRALLEAIEQAAAGSGTGPAVLPTRLT